MHVGAITPFAVASSSQFRPPPPPALTSAEYAAAFNEVKALGSATGSSRTADQTLVAGLWRVALNNHTVWNRIAQDLAAEHDLSLPETARLFALMDVALNDGLQTSNASKYFYELWRPVTAIQRADEDGNPVTEADPAWTTLHPTTPPYPAYASNASTIGAACATVLAGVFGGDVAFQVDWSAYGFPGVTRPYANFWAAADEMANARVYGGIHFRFDCAAGQQIGRDVAGYVLDNYLLPRDNPSSFSSGHPQGGAASAEGGISYAPLGLNDANPVAGTVNTPAPDDRASSGIDEIDERGDASAAPVDGSVPDTGDGFGASAAGGGITLTPGARSTRTCSRASPPTSPRPTRTTSEELRPQTTDREQGGRWGPYRQASPRRPGTAPSHGLRAVTEYGASGQTDFPMSRHGLATSGPGLAGL